MDYSRCEDPAYRTPYSLCGFCRAKIDKREDARWVNIGKEWLQISCTECAGRQREIDVHMVERLPEVDDILFAEESLDLLHTKVRELKAGKIAAIKKILSDEGVVKGITIYFRYKSHVVTGIKVDDYAHRCEVHVTMTPAKKDGTASKINETELRWHDCVRMWRMQRADIDAYLALMKEHEEEIKKRRTMKITDDML